MSEETFEHKLNVLVGLVIRAIERPGKPRFWLEADETIQKLIAEEKALRTENRRLREALEFYANKDAYLVDLSDDDSKVLAIVDDDHYGDRARAALAGEEA